MLKKLLLPLVFPVVALTMLQSAYAADAAVGR